MIMFSIVKKLIARMIIIITMLVLVKIVVATDDLPFVNKLEYKGNHWGLKKSQAGLWREWEKKADDLDKRIEELTKLQSPNNKVWVTKEIEALRKQGDIMNKEYTIKLDTQQKIEAKYYNTEKLNKAEVSIKQHELKLTKAQELEETLKNKAEDVTKRLNNITKEKALKSNGMTETITTQNALKEKLKDAEEALKDMKGHKDLKSDQETLKKDIKTYKSQLIEANIKLETLKKEDAKLTTERIKLGTEQTKLEQKIKEQNGSVKVTKQELERLNTTKKELLAKTTAQDNKDKPVDSKDDKKSNTKDNAEKLPDEKKEENKDAKKPEGEKKEEKKDEKKPDGEKKEEKKEEKKDEKKPDGEKKEEKKDEKKPDGEKKEEKKEEKKDEKKPDGEKKAEKTEEKKGVDVKDEKLVKKPSADQSHGNKTPLSTSQQPKPEKLSGEERITVEKRRNETVKDLKKAEDDLVKMKSEKNTDGIKEQEKKIIELKEQANKDVKALKEGRTWLENLRDGKTSRVEFDNSTIGSAINKADKFSNQANAVLAPVMKVIGGISIFMGAANALKAYLICLKKIELDEVEVGMNGPTAQTKEACNKKFIESLVTWAGTSLIPYLIGQLVVIKPFINSGMGAALTRVAVNFFGEAVFAFNFSLSIWGTAASAERLNLLKEYRSGLGNGGNRTSVNDPLMENRPMTLDDLEKIIVKKRAEHMKTYSLIKMQMGNNGILNKGIIEDLYANDKANAKSFDPTRVCARKGNKIDLKCECRATSSCMRFDVNTLPKQFKENPMIQKAVGTLNQLSNGNVGVKDLLNNPKIFEDTLAFNIKVNNYVKKIPEQLAKNPNAAKYLPMINDAANPSTRFQFAKGIIDKDEKGILNIMALVSGINPSKILKDTEWDFVKELENLDIDFNQTTNLTKNENKTKEDVADSKEIIEGPKPAAIDNSKTIDDTKVTANKIYKIKSIEQNPSASIWNIISSRYKKSVYLWETQSNNEQNKE
ncbi:MAG: hypothetical protein HQK49_06055 [Oligoflexia bacterium]|nr:hypothetical protein [Oligoflexia bacterium]